MINRLGFSIHPQAVSVDDTGQRNPAPIWDGISTQTKFVYNL